MNLIFKRDILILKSWYIRPFYNICWLAVFPLTFVEVHGCLLPLIFFFKMYAEELADSKGVIRIRKSKKNRQHNDQKKKDKKTKF